MLIWFSFVPWGSSFARSLAQVGTGGPFVPTATPTPTRTPTATPPGFRVVDLKTNDLSSDPTSGLLFVSIPSGAGSIGNSVTSIDPVSGRIAPPVWIGSEPNRPAVSSTVSW